MADVNKRIVVEVDAKEAEEGLSPVRRVLEDITKNAQYSGEAVSTAFENALKNAETFEDILSRVRKEFEEIGKSSPDFVKQRAEIEREYGSRIEATAPGAARQSIVLERNKRLHELNQDATSQDKFNAEFRDTSQRLIDALDKLVEAEKHKEEGGSESFLGGLLAQRQALIGKQLAAPTRREARSYTSDIEKINKQISSTTERNNGIGRTLGRAGLGVAGTLFGTDMGIFGAVGGGLPMVIAELGNIIVNTISAGLQTLQETNRGQLVSPSSVSSFGVTDRNGNLLENTAGDIRTGMSPAERTRNFINFIQQRGMSDRFSGELMYQQALTENAFGLQRGSLMPMERFKIRDTSGDTVTNLVQAFIQASKQENLFGFNKDDFSQLSDRISNVIQIIRDQQQNMNSVNMASGFSTLIMGQNIGGRFADRDTQVGLFNQLNSSIRNPGNDFRRAFIYQRLQQAHPGASFFDTMEQMQNGIYGGNLQAILGGLRTPGVNASKEEIDNYLLQVQGLTGLDYQAAGTLGHAIMRNPNVLNMQNTSKLLQQIGISPNFRDNEGRGVSQRAEASLTLAQDLRSFFQQVKSDIGVGINKLVAGNGQTNILLKEIIDNIGLMPGLPGGGWTTTVPRNVNVTHKPAH